MYNAKSISQFINKVNEEAEEAAQRVYDKYQEEYEKKLLAQIKKGDTIHAGMGTAFIENYNQIYVGQKLAEVLVHNEYNSINIGLNTPSKLTK